jgi:ABC-type phosphate transport system permease subunit
MRLVAGWRRVMDVKYNPLKYIPDPSLQTYFMLVLFTIWSVFFGFLAANYLGFFGYNTVVSIIIHMAILVPLAMTNAIFVDAERDGHKWLKEWKSEQSRYNLVVNRLKTKNLTIWNPNKEA